jgi:hypothetical protein
MAPPRVKPTGSVQSSFGTTPELTLTKVIVSEPELRSIRLRLFASQELLRLYVSLRGGLPHADVSDSPLEEDGLEPLVPLLRKALLGVANRRRRHDSRRHLRVEARDSNACTEWLLIAFPFASSNPSSSASHLARNRGDR